MSNSPMISYTKLSPNHSGPRTAAITRITPHCVVGQLSVEELGNVFRTKQASSNYGIGADGRIGMYVEEADRSWCSSSNDNDQQAVTIECASEKTAPYEFKAVVYEKLVDLCVDICKRNHKSRLIWIPEKRAALAYAPAPDEMLLTVHRWFSPSKSCPGDWMMARMGDLAEKVSTILSGTSAGPSGIPSDGSSEASGTNEAGEPNGGITREQRIWNFYLERIGNPYGVAGLMGNLFAESGLKPKNLQDSFNRRLGMTDQEYVAKVDDGTYTSFVTDGAGFGLAQWTHPSRKIRLLNKAKKRGVSIGNLKLQMKYLWKELQRDYPRVLQALRNATSVRSASDIVLTQFECPADQGPAVHQYRASCGEKYFTKYADVSGHSVSGTVRVRVSISDLNIRKSPTVDAAITGKTGIGTFTVTAVTPGKGSVKGWGKLASGAGWISMDFVEMV